MGRFYAKRSSWLAFRGVFLSIVFLLADVVVAQGNFGSHQHFVPNELIVKLKSSDELDLTVWLSRNQALRVKTFRSSGAHLMRFPDLVDIAKMMNLMRKQKEVEFAEPNYIYTLDSAPNDQGFFRLWGFHNSGQTGGNVGADIKALGAWALTRGSRDIKVAIIDTGIDFYHLDLKDNIWMNPEESGVDEEGRDRSSNGVDDDGNGYIDDYRGWHMLSHHNNPQDGHGHGTHVAGTIGAVGNNSLGVVGVNWEVSLIPIKAFSDYGSTTAAALIEAIEYATAVGAHLTNNSWGGANFSQALYDAILEAKQAGVFFIASAGNHGGDNDLNPYYPASYDLDNIISVAATDHRDRPATFSGYGLESVDISAPGVDIYSTLPYNQYGNKSGTSMAAPHVSGAVALLLSYLPNSSMQSIRARLLLNGDVLPTLQGRSKSGARINLVKALEAH